MSKRWIGNGLLLLGAMIWGAAFVAQSVGMDYLEPFTFQASRCFLGSLVLLPVIAVMDRRGVSRRPVTAEAKKQQLYFGLACGVIIFAACSLQQWGLLYTTPGKSGFLTSLYIILVPMAGLLFGRRVKPWVWGSVVLAVLGLYLLCGSTDFSLGAGELLTLGSAVAFCFHILVIDRASSQVDGVRLSATQFFICGCLSLVCAFLWETPRWENILACWIPIGYAGIFSSGIGYTFQIIGQAHTEPTVASLLMSLESVFSVIFGWIILRQSLTPTELLGCALVFAGVLISQIPGKAPAPKAQESY
ncbi:MAG TPA: DMT family transporter [Candidatus Avoscillospira avicola]|uniref:DMT family transporter n=1 Tax=Candidatus Avoscillospira avicola TaxID=2840706 RepID=A0A9D1DGA0_9FIRM|nr:DMT family transporter [Candidatus Avoscillospira avicola]